MQIGFYYMKFLSCFYGVAREFVLCLLFSFLTAEEIGGCLKIMLQELATDGNGTRVQGE